MSYSIKLRLWVLLSVACWFPVLALAHKGSDAFLNLAIDDKQITGYWDIHLRDLQITVGVDINSDGNVTWGEIYDQQPALRNYLATRLVIANEGEVCVVTTEDVQVSEHSDGVYVRFPLRAACVNAVTALTARYNFLFDLDAQHRALLSVGNAEGNAVSNTAGTETRVLSRDQPEVTLTRDASAFSTWRDTWVDYFKEGMWHIWLGFDHVLFLIAMILSAVHLTSKEVHDPKFSDVLRQAARIVTAFTLAHSITLGLTVFNVIRLPSSLVESVIALSVIIAALNNIKNILGRHLVTITFIFGLIHGMGFASVLAELGLPNNAKATALLAFNVGVEAGQLAIVAAVLPLIFWCRRYPVYFRRALPIGSLFIAGVAAVWLFERVTGTSLFSYAVTG